MIRSGTVVLILAPGPDQRPILLESLSDDREVEFVEEALKEGHPDPVWAVRQRRKLQDKEDEEFADYIENLVSEPHCKLEIQEHAFLWFKSRLNLEDYRRAEADARKVIADFALQVFYQDPSRTDFVLSSPNAEVRVRIHWVELSPLAESA